MNYPDNPRRGKGAGPTWMAACFLALAAPAGHAQSAFNDPGDPQHRIALLSAPNSVGRYGAFEAALTVATAAPNLQLPYDPAEPAYAAHLSPDEDAARGVSVDGLFLPAGQTDWSRAEDQPAFYYEGYDQNLAPTGEKDWHLRFAPDTVGQWQYRVRVSDAQGTALSAPQSFTVTASSSHGFVRVSPTDSRYFEYSDGTPFLPAGANDVNGNPSVLQSLIRDGAAGLTRVWIAGNGGMEVVGGGGNITTFHDVSYNPENDLPAGGQGYTDGQGGGTRFALAVGTQVQVQTGALLPGRSYTLTTHIRLTSPASCATPGQWGQTPTLQLWPLASAPLQDTGAWQTVSVHVPASHGAVADCNLGCNGTLSEFTPCLMDGWRITDDATGEAVVDASGVNWVTRYDQKNSARLDALFALAASSPAAPQCLKLCCFQHEDTEWGRINPDGTDAAAPSGTNAVGGSYTLDTPVHRFQAYFARYLTARWGWSPACFGVEHVNEGDPNNGIYFQGAQEFAAAVHAFAADHRPLASTSGWFAAGQGGYNWQFYEGNYQNGQGQPAYPDIDYADIHDYVYEGQYAYNTQTADFGSGQFGSAVVPLGGPTGGGYLRLTTGGSPAAPIPPLRGAGTWTIKFFYKSEPGAAYSVPGLGDWFTHSGGSFINTLLSTPIVETPGTPVSTWTEYTQPFTLTAPVTATNWTFHRGLMDSGAEDMADVRIYDPQGKLWSRYLFNEPDMVRDTAAYAHYLPLEEESYSGQPSIGKPLVIGETQPSGGSGQHAPYDVVNGGYYDAAGASLRQAAWGGVGAGTAVFQWWTDYADMACGTDGWKYYAATQRFMAGMPVSNGRYRSADPAVSTPNLIALGQQDAQAGNAYLYVYNRQATWAAHAAGTSVAPVTGTVALTGLPNGVYTVQRCDPGTGLGVTTETDTASGGVLTIPMNGLAQDVALKVTPASSQPTAPVVAQTVAVAAPTPPAPTEVIAIHAGGGAVGAFVPDRDASAGSLSYTTAAVSTAGVANAAPPAVYQTERYGNFTYTLPGLTPGAAYTLRLHFAEIYWSAAGQRLFNVAVNGTPVLTNFDVFKTAGGKNKALVETFPVKALGTGRVTITFTTVRDNAKVSGIELLK